MTYNTFDTLVVRDFASFNGEHTLKLDVPGLNYVKGRNRAEPRLGSNGAGKSKLLNAFCWCLYGKTSDDLGSTDIRPWHSNKQTYVRVTFTQQNLAGEQVKRKIERTAGPNSLKLDGRPCTQEDIDRTLGWSLSVFRQVVFQGQGQPLFHDLTNADKLRFLSDVCNLDQWDQYSDQAKESASAINIKLAKLSGQLYDGEVRCKELAAQVDRQKQVAAEWDEQIADKIKTTESNLRKATKELTKITKIHDELILKLEGYNLELKEAKLDLENLREKEREEALAVSAAKQARQALQRDLDTASAQLAELKSSRQCPTCGAAITKQSTRGLLAADFEAKIEECNKALRKPSADDSDSKHAALLDKVVIAKERCNALQKKVTNIEGERCLAFETKTRFDIETRSLKDDLEVLTNGENPHRSRLTELRKALKQAIAEDAEVGKKHAELSIKYERTKFWIKGFKDVRLFILEDILQELEFTTNNMLTAVGLIGWECTYAVERETKAGTTQRGLITTVTSPTQRSSVKWKAWSGGEGQRLRIAGALALSQVLLARAGVECNLEILDEPSRGLSTEGMDDLCEFLSERAKELNKAIYLVDHKAIESAKFDRIITIRKTEEGSSIHAL